MLFFYRQVTEVELIHLEPLMLKLKLFWYDVDVGALFAHKLEGDDNLESQLLPL